MKINLSKKEIKLLIYALEFQYDVFFLNKQKLIDIMDLNKKLRGELENEK